MQPIWLLIAILSSAGVDAGQGSTRNLPAASNLQDPAAVEMAILERALRFYAPPRNQSRWLDAERLPGGDAAPVTPLPPETVNRLVERLGRGAFCATTARDACRSKRGGRLRVSPVERSGNRAVVSVSFEHVQPAAPAITTTQVFTLEFQRDRWVITERRAATP